MDFNESISPLERTRSSDGFSDALEIARACNLGEPTLVIGSGHGYDFASARTAAAQAQSVTLETTRESTSSRALIAILTTLDAGAVVPLLPRNAELLSELKEAIWQGSSNRGDYQKLLDQDLEVAGLVGALIGAAESGIVAIINGLDAYAAAVLSQRLAFRSMDRCLAASPSSDPAIREAQHRLRLPHVLAAPVAKNASAVAFQHLRTTLQLTS